MIANKTASGVLQLTMVQSKSDTNINLYGLCNTEAAIVEDTPRELHGDLDGAAETDLGIM